jgi:hypothetical protein
MRPHNPDDLGVQLLDKLSGCRLVARADALETTGEVERFINHDVCL